MGQKFSTDEIAELHSELVRHGLDSFQTAEVLRVFAMGHGYGISHSDALEAASRVEGSGCSLEVLHSELENIAYVM